MDTEERRARYLYIDLSKGYGYIKTFVTAQKNIPDVS